MPSSAASAAMLRWFLAKLNASSPMLIWKCLAMWRRPSTAPTAWPIAAAPRSGLRARCARAAMCALAKIVQHQSRHHQGEPVDADRASAKMPHIGVQRFAASQRQKHRAEHGEGHPAVGAPEIGESVTRIKRYQYSGPSEDMRDPGEPEYHEPR